MSIEIRVPALPESVADATVAAWHKKPGDAVKRDENIVDLETDKVVLEVPSPVDGVLTQILKHTGDIVTANELLAAIEDVSGQKIEKTASEDKKMSKNEKTLKLSPAVRKMVSDQGLDAAQIDATGKGGRITKTDVLKHVTQLSQQEPVKQEELAVSEAVANAQVKAPVLQAAPFDAGMGRTEQRVAMTRLRARVAERLVQAQQNAAILTTFNEVNLASVMDLRKKYKQRFEIEHEIKLGMMSFFVKASIDALKRFPIVNASVDGNDIIYHGYFDIGVAVSSPRGLVVPIVRDANQKTFAEIEATIIEYANKAKDGSLGFEDLMGGTFTISNGGIFGSMLSTPILNPPQSAILGMHTIMQRPVVENGEIVIRPMMYLALSYDHRIVDGRDAVQFLVRIKESLEDPGRLLLEI